MISRIGPFVIALILALSLGYFSIQRFALETLLDKNPSPDQLLAMDQLTRTNSIVPADLGRFFQYSTEAFDLDRATGYYLASLSRDPYDAGVWVDLSRAYDSQGKVDQARLALKNATLAAPSSTAVHWAYANFLIRNRSLLDPQGSAAAQTRLGDEEGTTQNVDVPGNRSPSTFQQEFLSELKRSVDLNSTMLNAALDLSIHAGMDTPRVAGLVVPMKLDDQLWALGYFAQKREWEAASVAWNNLVSHFAPDALANSRRPALTMEKTVPYINMLIAAGRVDEATEAWNTGLRLTHYLEGSASRAEMRNPLSLAEIGGDPDSLNNLLFNYAFQRPTLNGGFDWVVQSISGVTVQIDRQVFLKNHRSLLIDFLGKGNVDYAGLVQYVPVRPDQQYEFVALVKSEGLTTDEGPRFELYDYAKPALMVQSPQVLGDHDWFELRATMDAGPDTHLLAVRLRRAASQKFDNLIQGRLWIDHVELRAVSPAG
ncbi:MAG: tetratricopeptide repeat protein [Acidobacteriia bacterium]|nr:tetratricopeptide repeat protein [Terriglobia bacterium]